MHSKSAASPWSVEEHDECFIVRDADGQALGYFYFDEDAGAQRVDRHHHTTGEEHAGGKGEREGPEQDEPGAPDVRFAGKPADMRALPWIALENDIHGTANTVLNQQVRCPEALLIFEGR